MALRNVASNFTFEQQRVEINEIASDLFGLETGISTGNATLTGYLRGPESFTIDPATHGDNTGTVVIAGNLTVNGTTTTINSTTLSVDDKIVRLGDVSTPTNDTADGGGIVLEAGATDHSFLYNKTDAAWVSSLLVKSANGFEGNVTGSATTAATVTTAAQTNITSLGTLVGLRIGVATTTANTAGDDLAIEGASDRGLSIISGNTSSANIYLGRSNDPDACRVTYQNNDNALDFYVNAEASRALRLASGGVLTIGHAVASGNPGQKIGKTTIQGHHVNAAGSFAELYLSNSFSAGGANTPTASIRGERDGQNWGTALTFYTNNTDTQGGASGDGTEKVRIHATGQLELKVPDSVSTLKLTPSGTNASATIDFNTPGTGSAVFKVQNTETLRITSTGQLLQTANRADQYTAKFKQSNAANPAWIEIDSPADSNVRPAYIQLQNAGTDKWGIGQVYASTSSGAFHLCAGTATEANSKLTLSTSGNLGIGSVNPSQPVTIKRSSAGQAEFGYRFEFEDTNGPTQTSAAILVGGPGIKFKNYNSGRGFVFETGHVEPADDNTQNLGASGKRWANVYTGDMHLNNMNTGGNDVDGSEGHWTMQEGSDDLFLINRNTGKKYKFNLTEVS